MSIYDTLNDKQMEAVCCTEGPLLILAGAGSGKTRVLTHRVVYLIEEKQVNPYYIMAITFTNKAAGEMRERIDEIVGFGSESIWVATFHATCVRILRRYAEYLGYDKNFTIYDTEDQKTVIREVCRRCNIDTRQIKESSILNRISHAKDELKTPDMLEKEAYDYGEEQIAKAYREYQRELFSNNAMDFDDLIVKTIELFEKYPEILEGYQERFRYIMVDEYQDTNLAQFRLIYLLAKKYQNLCVVGDDDQSIYKFRGANIENILSFERVFPHTTVIKLEQNYRSTQNILDCANEVIKKNTGRKEKELWTANGKGEKLHFHQFDTSFEEAEFICGDIRKRVREGEYDYSDCAILYRTNAQSRIFEEKFIYANIPYKIIGGINFYSRKEIKDIIAYLKTIDNGKDDLAVKRIINVPKRGIGATTLNRIDQYAQEKGISFYDALLEQENISGISRSSKRISYFTNIIQVLRAKMETYSLAELVEELLEVTGYQDELIEEDTEESRVRIENINELITKIVAYEEKFDESMEEKPTLSGFLEEVALIADIDNLEEEKNYVVLMTLHSAKGLEFPNVYLAGMEDGLFPSFLSIASNSLDEIEEERRLCYVGITRAEKTLTMTAARQRMIRGEWQFNGISRFIKELPKKLFLEERPKEKMPEQPINNASYLQAKQNFRSKAFSSVSNKIEKSGSLDYGIGDTVKHAKFGVGTVTNIQDGGRDFEVTVEFETAGVKRLFASFAKLQKV